MASALLQIIQPSGPAPRGGSPGGQVMRAGGNKAWLDDVLKVILSNLD
jgi:hypothetical protein